MRGPPRAAVNWRQGAAGSASSAPGLSASASSTIGSGSTLLHVGRSLSTRSAPPPRVHAAFSASRGSSRSSRRGRRVAGSSKIERRIWCPSKHTPGQHAARGGGSSTFSAARAALGGCASVHWPTYLNSPGARARGEPGACMHEGTFNWSPWHPPRAHPLAGAAALAAWQAAASRWRWHTAGQLPAPCGMRHASQGA